MSFAKCNRNNLLLFVSLQPLDYSKRSGNTCFSHALDDGSCGARGLDDENSSVQGATSRIQRDKGDSHVYSKLASPRNSLAPCFSLEGSQKEDLKSEFSMSFSAFSTSGNDHAFAEEPADRSSNTNPELPISTHQNIGEICSNPNSNLKRVRTTKSDTQTARSVLFRKGDKSSKMSSLTGEHTQQHITTDDAKEDTAAPSNNASAEHSSKNSTQLAQKPLMAPLSCPEREPVVDQCPAQPTTMFNGLSQVCPKA